MVKRTTTKGQKKTCQQTNFLHHFSRNGPTMLTECVVLFCELLFVLFFSFHLYCLSFLNLWFLIISLISSNFSFTFWTSSQKPRSRIGSNLNVIRPWMVIFQIVSGHLAIHPRWLWWLWWLLIGLFPSTMVFVGSVKYPTWPPWMIMLLDSI